MNPLYKYQTFEPDNLEKKGWLRELLLTGNLHCSSYSAMNDPMEGVYEYLHTNNENMSQAVDAIRYNKDRRKICCLTRSYQHNLMWAYYAGGHQGICVEVDDILEPRDNYKRFDIRYIHQMPIVSSGTDIQEAVTKILTTKSKQWKHEQEVRYLVNNDDTLHAHIRRIFAGCKMLDRNYRELEQLVAEVNEHRMDNDRIRVVRMRKENVDYGWSAPVNCD